MAEESRAHYSMVNSTVSVVCKVAAILFGYLTRVVLIRTLSTDYVGLNGLLVNILGALSLTMMGLSTALAYAMYVPAAQGDEAKQRSLLRLYGKVYRAFALGVLCFGALLYPFLPLLLRKPWEAGSLPLILALHTVNAALSYCWAYKGMMFLVSQRDYVNELFTAAFTILQSIAQCVVLLLTRDYFLFLLLYLCCTLLRNICTTWYAERKFPLLYGEEYAPLEREEYRGILRNIRAILLNRVGAVVISNTDNLLLTYFFGLAAVGAYANYFLIIASVGQVLDRVVYGITASVGNLGATEGPEQVGKVYRASLLATSWLYGFAAICLAELLGPFVELSFGSDYLLPRSLTLVLCLNLYLNGMRSVTMVFRDSLGLMWYDRHKSIAEALINLFASIWLVRAMGMTGVFLGTTVSIVLLPFWLEPLVLYRRYLKQPMAPYFARYFTYFAVSALAFGATAAICRHIGGSALARLLLSLPVCLTVPNLIFFLLLHGTWEFRLLWDTFFPLLRDRLIKK